MTIAANSRYANSQITTLDVDGTSRQVILPTEPVASTFQYIAHTYALHETLDGLASTYFADPTQWWKIANANPEIMDWSSVAPGYTLRIPVGS